MLDLGRLEVPNIVLHYIPQRDYGDLRQMVDVFNF